MKLDISTFTAVVGTSACNAKCPYCVSKMTSQEKLKESVNWRNFEIGARMAEKTGVTTCLLTGKGEPTLYPDLITSYIKAARKYFPVIELQTNGIMLLKDFNYSDVLYLEKWYNHGLTTMCISCISHERYKNQFIFGNDDYPDLKELIEVLKEFGYSIRLNVTMIKGGVDNEGSFNQMVNFAKQHKVEQLTFRPVTSAGYGSCHKWVQKHNIDDYWPCIIAPARHEGIELMKLVHGGTVYDLHGQNVCISNCLTIDPDDNILRQLIFFPDGHLRYDWRYKGATIL